MMFVYRFLLGLYPQEHRARFENEMLLVMAAKAADARSKGILERGLVAAQEVVGLLLGLLRERRSSARRQWESPLASLQAPATLLSLYLLCRWTMVDQGLHALFSPLSYALAGAGILLTLWLVGSQRVSGRWALAALVLFCWWGLPLGLSLSEASFRAGVREHPVEFAYAFPGGSLQALVAGDTLAVNPGGHIASETIVLPDQRSLLLVMASANDAPPYRLLFPACLMAIAFWWRRRHSRLAVAR